MTTAYNKLLDNIEVSETAARQIQAAQNEWRQRIVLEMRTRPSMREYSVDYHLVRRTADDPDFQGLIEKDSLARQRATMYGLVAIVTELRKLQQLQKLILEALVHPPREVEIPTPTETPTEPR